MSCAEAAYEYAVRGWSVIPLRFSGTVEDRKKPLLDSWDPYKTVCATPEQVEAWWKKWPKANVGLVMGAVSGMVALDLDGPNATALLKDSGVVVPRTASVQTGKGYHAFYLHPGYPVSNRARLLTDGEKSGVDVRGDGGYVVAPPSLHGSGRTYQWVIHPDEGIEELSPSLRALIERRGQLAAPAEPADASWVDAAMAGVGEGQRDDTATRLAGYWLHKLDGNIEDTLRILRPWGLRCHPEFPERDIHKCVQSVARLHAAEQAERVAKHQPNIEIVSGERWAEELREAKPDDGIRLPVAGFDAMPIVPGRLYVVAGRPGMGKSTLACAISVAAMTKDLPTYIVSTEMNRLEWGLWMACLVAETTNTQLPRPIPERVLMPWKVSPIAISDPGTISIAEIRALAETQIGLRILIVDHIGRIAGGRKDNRVLEVGDVARGLKSIAKDLHCTVIALCQLNRRVEGDEIKRPRLADLRESGEIEQEANAVLFIWTQEKDLARATLDMHLTLAKNRHGPMTHTEATFEKARHKFVVKQANESEEAS